MIKLWALWKANNGRCFYCGVHCTIGKYKLGSLDIELFNKRKATRDHYIPKCYGGTGNKDNIVLSCLQCNRNKKDKLPWQLKKS